MLIPALPFTYVILRGQKRPPVGYPTDPQTIGENLRKRRMDLGLRQVDVAEVLGVSVESVRNWECGECAPAPQQGPGIEAFPSGSPLEPGDSIRSQLRYLRWRLRLNQQGLAELLGVNRCTIASWENGAFVPNKANQRRISEQQGGMDAPAQDQDTSQKDGWGHSKPTRPEKFNPMIFSYVVSPVSIADHLEPVKNDLVGFRAAGHDDSTTKSGGLCDDPTE